jgi:hypothetical protein
MPTSAQWSGDGETGTPQAWEDDLGVGDEPMGDASAGSPPDTASVVVRNDRGNLEGPNGTDQNARCDHVGQYFVERLHPGEWHALYRGTSIDNSSGTAVGTILIRSGQDTHFDVVVPGDRSLTGRIALTDMPDVEIELELRVSDRILARGSPYDIPARAEPVRDDEVPDDDVPNKRPRASFEFRGLPREQSMLRVTCGWHKEGNQPVYVDLPVDLTNGDVDLGTVQWTFQEFTDRWVKETLAQHTNR